MTRPLRVLLLHPGASWSTADVESGLRYGLVKHGVEVIQYRLDQRIDASKRWLYAAWRRAQKGNPAIEKPTTEDIFYHAASGSLEMALNHLVDAVVIVSAMFMHPNMIELLKRAKLTVTVLFTESPYDMDKELKVARMVDGCWTNERSSLAAFQAVNANSGYLPHAWHPQRHQTGAQPGDEVFPQHDVVFVGSAFHERVTWLQSIDWTGIDLGLYGSWAGLPSRSPLRAFVKDAQIDNAVTAALYRRAKIGLNLYRKSMGWGRGAPQIAHAESMNPRGYELAACGAFHLSDARAEVRELFGDLVPTFETSAQASDLIRRWLADDAGRRAIASQLPARVAESSWAERAACVIGDLHSLIQARAA